MINMIISCSFKYHHKSKKSATEGAKQTMKKYRFHKLQFVIATALLVNGIAVASVLEEVIVTAQKREQSSQDVGIAITAMTGDQMEALNYVNAQQVAQMAPGVTIVQPNGEANYAIAIRGVANSDFVTNVESPVAISAFNRCELKPSPYNTSVNVEISTWQAPREELDNLQPCLNPAPIGPFRTILSGDGRGGSPGQGSERPPAMIGPVHVTGAGGLPLLQERHPA
jgi:hypothetical protein